MRIGFYCAFMGQATVLFSGQPLLVFYKNKVAGDYSNTRIRAIIPLNDFLFHFYENFCFLEKRKPKAGPL
jgi:hypothetical protein